MKKFILLARTRVLVAVGLFSQADPQTFTAWINTVQPVVDQLG